MIYPRSWQYAIRILLHLAGLEPGAQASARAIAEAAGIPPAYTAKLLSVLANHKLVRSRRGPHGGVTLARPPQEIQIEDVTRAIGEEKSIRSCILGFRECSDEAPCPIHPVWKAMRQDLQGALLERTLADFRDLTPSPPTRRPAARKKARRRSPA